MKNTIWILLSALVLSSCQAGLERIEISSDNEESVFSDKVKTRQALNNLYGSMRAIGGLHSFTDNTQILLDGATDNGRPTLWIFGVSAFNQSTLKPDQAPFASGWLPWRDYYKAIRMANVFLRNIANTPLTDEEKADMAIEARFLRTFYYCELLKGYGALVLVGNDTPDGLAIEGYQRANLESTVEYIVGELDELIPQMKTAWESNLDYGRATKGMAMAYKARVLLYYASPLNTEGCSAGEIQTRWQAAADAAWDLIDLDLYDLHPEFDEFFVTRKTDENILSYLRGLGVQAYTMSLSSEYAGGNICGMRPTFNLVDAFLMKDGKKPVLGYANGQAVFNPQVTNYSDANLTANRDPRLAMQVIMHGDQMPINGSMVTINLTIVDQETASGRNAFLVKKYMKPGHDFKNAGNIDQNAVMMRYADVLLMFAEADNQANGPTATAIETINRVRVRAGADPLDETDDPYGVPWTKTTLDEHIKVERRMEFFAEEQRFWDARRWKLGPEILGATVYGGQISEGKYVRTFIENRKFSNKMYRLPIPPDEVNKSEGRIWQNPDW